MCRSTKRLLASPTSGSPGWRSRISSPRPARCSAPPPTSRPSRRSATGQAASDRYALAVVAFELLTGKRPFAAENFAAQARAHVEDDPIPPSERNPDLPAEVDQVISRGLEKDPGARYGSAGELVDRLDDALTAARPPRPRRAPACDRRRPAAPHRRRRRTGRIRARPLAAVAGRPGPRRRSRRSRCWP